MSKLFSQAGDILQAINSLEPHIQQNWFKPLQELFSAAQPFALVSSTDENAASPEEPREANSAAANPEALQTQHSLSQKIQKDFKELLVELPSNLPGRAKLDSDLTALFSMINGLLSTTTLASLSAQGLALYNSTEFKALMDLISKISAVAGSDFIYEMVSSYRALLTAQLSAAIQRALTEEIFFGYRPGVLTKGLYQKAEVLAGYGLIDMPTLYTEQLSHLHKQDSDVIIKNHFAAYIESLLKGYATQQKTEWDIMHGNLIKERSEISNEVEKLKRQNTHSRLSTEGKDLDAKQQSFELKKAQINRLIVTKNRAIRFLEDYAAAEHKNRATLASHYAAQEKVWTKLSRIVRQLTMTKWDLYYYEFEKFNTHIRKINDLLGLLETYIDQLATGKPLTTLQASAQNITQKNKDLPPAMQCLFTLALQTIEKDLKYLAPVDAGTNAQLTEQSEPLARHQEVAHPIVEPIQELYKALMDYAHEKAGQLDVKDEWYQRNIIEHLEIFAEMWSEEKTHDPQIIKRRNEILNALQAENAPDYRFLSHPADVKIVYLLTVSGEHGLDLHSRILSKNGMLRANAQFHSQSEGVVRLVEKNEGDTVSVDDIKMAIHSYQRSRKPDAFFNGRGNFLLTDINISYLNDTAKKYALQTNTKGGKKLRAIYNALVNKNYKELLTAVSIKTGFINSDDINKGGFKDQSDETPSPKNNAKPS